LLGVGVVGWLGRDGRLNDGVLGWREGRSKLGREGCRVSGWRDGRS